MIPDRIVRVTVEVGVMVPGGTDAYDAGEAVVAMIRDWIGRRMRVRYATVLGAQAQERNGGSER